MVALLKRPGEYQPQPAGHPTSSIGATQLIPFPPQPDLYAPAPVCTVHSGIPVTEDLKSLASRHLHNPGSHVDKLRMKRNRSGAVQVKVLVSLGIPNFSSPPQLGHGAPAISVRVLLHFSRMHIQRSLLYLLLQEVSHDGPLGHVPLHPSVTRPSPGSSGIGYPMHFGMPVTENLKDLAIRYLHNPGTRVGKLRMRQSGTGSVKVLILLEIDDTM
jgi:hypothetical protein